MKTLHLDKEFDKMFELLYSKKNFAFLRFADGERAIMLQDNVESQEGWVVPHNENFAKDLFQALSLEDNNVFYAISCPCCDFPAAYWYQQHIKNKNLTFANLWINKNHRRFRQYFDKLRRETVVVANFRAKDKQIGNLNILQYYEISDDCEGFYKNELKGLLKQIKEDLSIGKLQGKKNLLFVVSAGPLSEIIIYDLFRFDKEQTYVDFGSSVDCYYKDYSKDKAHKRPYMIAGNEYAERNCYLEIYESNEMDISVVLNLYKRPYALPLQLEAIKNQSLKPKEILLYQDGVFEGIKIPKECKAQFDNIEISQVNKGVWERFRFAKKAKSPFVCVFDDDTIPSRDYLANCFYQMKQQEGLYGAIGIVLQNPQNYPNSDFIRLGWANPNESRVEVDFVGHSWFFKKEWLDDLFAGTKSLQDFKTAGEDMGFSLALQRKGIKTFVPPQPYKKPHLWGNNPQYAKKYGDDNVALFNTNESRTKYNNAIKEAINLGFKTLKERNLATYKQTLRIYHKACVKQNGFIKWYMKCLEKFVKRKIRNFLKIVKNH